MALQAGPKTRWLAPATALLLLTAGTVAASTARVPTFVRMWGSLGNGGGQFDSPFDVAVDSAGNVYVADTFNHRMQKFSSNGTFLMAWGEFGFDNGQLNSPWGVGVDAADNVYVADTGNHRIQKFTSSGAYLTQWGSEGSGDGEFGVPLDVAVDATGNVYVVDGGDNSRIQRFTPAGGFISKWGSAGTGNGEFNGPSRVAVGSNGNVYVVDNGNNRVQKFTAAGVFLAKWGSTGSDNGQFQSPAGIAIDRADNVYISDTFQHRIQKFSATGTFRGAWGSPGTGNGQFDDPVGVALGSAGSLYVADASNNRIQQFTLTRVIVGLGSGGAGWMEDMSSMSPHGLLSFPQVSWAAYNAANGETRPVLCDVDGDRRDELVLGLGNGGNGWAEIKDDADAGFAHLAWIQVNWPAYNAANGETWPACGDIDGDGRDEIVLGLGDGGGGWVRVFDHAATGYAPMAGTPTAGGWIQVPWSAYNSANGAVHPAVGNLDGDGPAEIVFGLGDGSAGWVHIRDDQVAGFANMAGTPSAGGWLRLGWSAYQAANGATWPAIGDLDGDDRTELVLGLGNGAGGWLRAFQTVAGGFGPAPGTPGADGWLRVNWVAYSGAVGATYPAIGDLDGDGKSELIVGFETYTAAGGYLEVFNDLTSGLTHRAWPRVPWPDYNSANGLTRPAVSR